jgi:hypothetical protein
MRQSRKHTEAHPNPAAVILQLLDPDKANDGTPIQAAELIMALCVALMSTVQIDGDCEVTGAACGKWLKCECLLETYDLIDAARAMITKQAKAAN